MSFRDKEGTVLINKYRTQAGLNYIMDEELYNNVCLLNPIKDTVYKMERIIEASEYLPGFSSFIAFIVFSCIGYNEILQMAICLTVAYFIGAVLSLSFTFINIFKGVLTLYGIISKYFIKYVFVALFSILYLHNWILFLVYIVISILGGVVYSLLFGYRVKLSFNNKVAEYVLKN